MSEEEHPRPRGRPKLLTDGFLQEVTRLARQAHSNAYTINSYIAVRMADVVGYLPNEETVRGWRRAAAARRRQLPDDDDFLGAGELRGKPTTTATCPHCQFRVTDIPWLTDQQILIHVHYAHPETRS